MADLTPLKNGIFFHNEGGKIVENLSVLIKE